MEQRTFSQGDVNAIVGKRLAEDRAKGGRVQPLNARAFEGIMQGLLAQVEAKQTHDKAVERATKDMTIAESFKQQAIERLGEKLTEQTNKNRADVLMKLFELREHAEKAASSFDASDVRLMNALTMIRATGGNMDAVARHGLIQQFIGNLPALSMLRGAMGAQGISEPLFDALIFDPGAKLASIETLIGRAFQWNGSIALAASELVNIAGLYGIEIQVPDIEEAAGSYMATRHGLI